jgi:hypothetical protein
MEGCLKNDSQKFIYVVAGFISANISKSNVVAGFTPAKIPGRHKVHRYNNLGKKQKQI